LYLYIGALLAVGTSGCFLERQGRFRRVQSDSVIQYIPGSLEQALERLNGSHRIRENLGPYILAKYQALKLEESHYSATCMDEERRRKNIEFF
jgi:glutamine synthetase